MLIKNKTRDDPLLRVLDSITADLDDQRCCTLTETWAQGTMKKEDGGFGVKDAVAVAEKLFCELDDDAMTELIALLKDEEQAESASNEDETPSELSSLLPPSAERKLPNSIDTNIPVPVMYRLPKIPRSEEKKKKASKKRTDEEEAPIDYEALATLRAEKAAAVAGKIYPSPPPFGLETDTDTRCGDSALHDAIEQFRLKAIPTTDDPIEVAFYKECYGKCEVNVLMLTNLASYANDAAQILDAARAQYGYSKFKREADKQLKGLLLSWMESDYDSTRWTHNAPELTVRNFTEQDVDVAVALCENSIECMYFAFCEHHDIVPTHLCFAPLNKNRCDGEDGDGDSSGDRAKGTKQPMVLSNVKKLAIKIHNLTSFVCDKRDARASEQDFREACQLLQRFELGLYVSVASASFKRATICSPFDKGSITVMNGGATQNMKIFIKTPPGVLSDADLKGNLAAAGMDANGGARDTFYTAPAGSKTVIQRAAWFSKALLSAVTFSGHGTELLHSDSRADPPPNQNMLDLAKATYAFSDEEQIVVKESSAATALASFYDQGSDGSPPLVQTYHGVLWNSVVNSGAVNYSAVLSASNTDQYVLAAPLMDYAEGVWRPAKATLISPRAAKVETH